MSSFSASVDLAPVGTNVRVARHVVEELLAAWGARHDRGDAALLVTELVANVVDHVAGDASFTLELTMSGDWLRIAVVDGSAVPPVVQELCADRPRGRGLQMVEAISDRWGYEEHLGGKRIWFDLSPCV